MASKVDLSDLTHFVRVAERESFSAAARELGVPTSTVSRSIARLEEALGIRLLERTTRKVVPTASGKALFASVTAPLHALSEATESIAAFRDRPCGTLRVSVPIDLSPAVAAVTTAFMEEYPDVSVEVSVSNRQVDLVAEGFDLALRAGKLADSSLVARKVGELGAHIFAAPAYLAKHGTPKTLRDLEAHESVLFRGKEGKNTWTLENGAKHADVVLKGRLSGDDFSFVRAGVLAAGGIGVMPEALCRVDVLDGALVRLLAPWEMRVGALFVVVPSNKHLPPRVVAYRDYVLENFLPSLTTRRR